MADIVFMDSFDDRTSTALKWSTGTSPGVQAGSGRTGNCFSYQYNSDEMKRNLPRMQAFYLGFAIKPNVVNANHTFLTLYDSVAGQSQLYLQLLGTLLLNVYLGDGTLLLSSSPQALADGTWAYVELYAYIHDTAGALQLKVNGVSVASASAIDTKRTNNAFVNQIALNGSANSKPYLDDLYIATDGFQGGLKIYSVLPARAGDLTQLSPSTSSNWTCVDEANPNDNTDYVYGSGTTSEDLYHFGTFTDSAEVRGLQVWTRAERDDLVVRQYTPQCKSVSTDSSFAEVTTSNGTYYDDVQMMNIDPATGVAWTTAGINAAQFGVRITV